MGYLPFTGDLVEGLPQSSSILFYIEYGKLSRLSVYVCKGGKFCESFRCVVAALSL